MEVKHSVLVVSYMHKAFVREALDSVVNQSELPYEIVVLDDCSTDGTWEVILEYKNKYPNLFKCFQNEVNLGVFENINKLRSLASGNVISLLAADDYLGLECIKTVNDSIKENGINGMLDKALVILNSQHLHLNGSLTLWNNYVERGVSLIKTRLRYSLSYRGIGYTKVLFESIPSEEHLKLKHKDLGYGYDFIKGFEEVIKADQYFYKNEVGGIYRLGVGVTKKSRTQESFNALKATHLAIKKVYGKLFDKSDLIYIDFITTACRYKIKPSMRGWFKTLILLVRNRHNFGYNNPLVRNIHFLLPYSLVEFLKKQIFPLFLRVRVWFS